MSVSNRGHQKLILMFFQEILSNISIYFMEIFKEIVEKRIDPRGRLTRLIKYTNGEAKDLIKHCIQQPLSEGYKNALELLRIRYGDSLKVLTTYRKEIRRWPTIKAGDASSFRSFHNFLLKCQSVTSNQTWNSLDSPDTLCLMIANFPQHTRDRWICHVLLTKWSKNIETSMLSCWLVLTSLEL